MLLLCSLLLAAENHVFGLPAASYDTDDGLGFGVRLELTRVEEGVDPYLASVVIQGYGSLNGYQHHRIRIDVPGIGADGRHRLTTHFAWRQWLSDSYFGLGNGATEELALRQSFAADDPRRNYYSYSLFQPFAHMTWRTKLSGPWSVFGALNVKYSAVRPYAGSLLEAEQPFGMSGGLSIQGMAGVLLDTRTPEISPVQGWLIELSGRVAPDIGAGGFSGGLFSARSFWSLSEHAVFAWRGMGEYLVGEVPFYEMVQWGGLYPVMGFGGSEGVRGLPFGRFHGPGKAIANTELRVDVLEHNLFHRPVRWQIVPFADAGAVFGASELTDPPPVVPVHPGVGGGLRIIFDRTLVGRVDVANAWTPVEIKGEVKQEPNLGFYLSFDHTF